MELKFFLDDVAAVFEATDHTVANHVASLIRNIEVGTDIDRTQLVTTPQSLKSALAAPDCLSAASQLDTIADGLPWTGAKGFRKAPKSFTGNYHFVPIVGPNDLIRSNEFRTGIFIQDAGTFYPPHKHEAEELYLPLSGTAWWQKDKDDFEAIESGNLIHHQSYQPHATWTKEVPMLAVWAWLGNLTPDSYSYL